MTDTALARLPARTLMLSVFVVASCGLAYELIAAALSSYLLGDSSLQFSSIIGCYLFAMGVGAHLSKYVPEDQTLSRFVDIEFLTGLIGALSASLLFAVFAFAGAPFRTVLYGLVLVLGVLVGMEIPLVMRVLNARRAQFHELVARVLTFDYLGALAVSLLFPLVLAPRLGLARTAFLFGILNVLVALFTLRIFRADIPRAGQRAALGSLLLGLLIGGFVYSERWVGWAEKAYFGDEILFAKSTPYQRLVVTRWKDDLRLYINGNLQFSSRDEHRYHEALVHPALTRLPWARRVLILGGGDGLALREVLKYPHIEHVTLVDLDPDMTQVFSTSGELVKLNQGALRDARVTVVNEDAARWLERNEHVFDAVIADFPDPSNFSLGKLYSVPFYRLLAKHLAEQGLAVVQSTSPYFAPRAFWSIDATLKEAGFHTAPYHCYVPSFGEWGFVIAAKHAGFTPPTEYRVPLRFLDGHTTALMFSWPRDMPPLTMEANRLNTQSLVQVFEEDWRRVMR
jgi:spermidine synthase